MKEPEPSDLKMVSYDSFHLKATEVPISWS